MKLKFIKAAKCPESVVPSPGCTAESPQWFAKFPLPTSDPS